MRFGHWQPYRSARPGLHKDSMGLFVNLLLHIYITCTDDDVVVLVHMMHYSYDGLTLFANDANAFVTAVV